MATKKRIFCDTNILLDAFDPEREHHDDALALLWFAADNPGTIELIASISSFKNAYYILTRLYHSAEEAQASIEGLMGRFIQPVDFLASYGTEALASDEPDFEDALIRASAEHEGVFAIVSRDANAFACSNIPKLSAAELLEREGFDCELVEF